MATQDTKEEILLILRRKGPSLPVHIAKELGLSILFTSAYLSELLSEKKIKISFMRVGSSPIYFIPGQEQGLEKYSQHLKSKEKEAFLILKQKKFLKDDVQLPAIRVALREINDFAIPFKRGDEIFWRFFTVSERDFKTPSRPTSSRDISLSAPKALTGGRARDSREVVKSQDETLNIFDEKKEKLKKAPKPIKKKAAKKKAVRKKQENKFFIKVKDFLSKKGIEISDIVGFSRTDLTLRVNIKGKEKLLVAYNKKRINEADITKAHKKATEHNLKYILLCLGEPLKKLSNLIGAVKDLDGIERIE